MHWDPADDWDTWSDDYCSDERDRDDYDSYEREPRPDFGCACEDALIVDTVCENCIAYLQDQWEEAYWADQNLATREGP